MRGRQRPTGAEGMEAALVAYGDRRLGVRTRRGEVQPLVRGSAGGHRCPHCGGAVEVQQVRAVRARWAQVRRKETGR